MRYKGKKYSTFEDLTTVIGELANAGDTEKAKEFLFFYAIDTWEERGCTFAEAEKICETNIGYLAGYHDPSTAANIYEVFDVSHPVFGRRTDVTPEEALKAGQEWGKLMKKEAEDG